MGIEEHVQGMGGSDAEQQAQYHLGAFRLRFIHDQGSQSPRSNIGSRPASMSCPAFRMQRGARSCSGLNATNLGSALQTSHLVQCRGGPLSSATMMTPTVTTLTSFYAQPNTASQTSSLTRTQFLAPSSARWPTVKSNNPTYRHSHRRGNQCFICVLLFSNLPAKIRNCMAARRLTASEGSTMPNCFGISHPFDWVLSSAVPPTTM
ncbi:hypothetical protein N657DRAFT_57990 [Parathielavia appendiculata]|uniref:Uncharacterized protein n=1 Tax=Parathielavia appendiculata TaxID=2587402 RepID=A0AAN6UA42_9PEZI|nr:hypothetical protein N657DRAFT_57990 [Parathielavia appendiculata]